MGFPSPAMDYIQSPLNLHDYLVSHPSATFFFRVEGNTGLFLGFNPGDLLVVDRSLDLTNSQVAIAVYEGQFRVVQVFREYRDVMVKLNQRSVLLLADTDIEIWGIATSLVRRLS
jgi:DNA polymerase V